MFKIKTKNDNIKILKRSINEGKEIITHRVQDGMKYAQDHIVYLSDFVRKNPNINFLKGRIQKHPTSGLIAVAGLGLIVYGLFKMARK